MVYLHVKPFYSYSLRSFFFQSELAGKDVHNPIKELVRQRPSKVTNRRFKEVSFHIIYNNQLYSTRVNT